MVRRSGYGGPPWPSIVKGVEDLRESHRETNFVAQILGFVDDLELLVLVPNELKGFRVQCEAVATNAHLFTLLQGALIGGGHLAGEPIDPEVIAVARGETPRRAAVARSRVSLSTPPPGSG